MTSTLSTAVPPTQGTPTVKRGLTERGLFFLLECIGRALCYLVTAPFVLALFIGRWFFGFMAIMTFIMVAAGLLGFHHFERIPLWHFGLGFIGSFFAYIVCMTLTNKIAPPPPVVRLSAADRFWLSRS
jgi:hypothetical protein